MAYWIFMASVTYSLLLQLHEHSYRPIRPKDAILPPPQPPTDHLLAAVEEFYKEETEETKRNP